MDNSLQEILIKNETQHPKIIDSDIEGECKIL